MKTLRISRRTALRGAGSAALLTSLPLGLRVHAQPGKRALVFVVLRGAADGLSLAIPTGDPRLARLRPSTLPSITEQSTLIEGFFALHPRLAAWHPAASGAGLTLWPAVGFAQPTRSHAEAELRLWTALRDRAGADSIWRLGEARDTAAPALGTRLDALAARIERDAAPLLAWLEIGGWDTHAAQRVRLDTLLGELGPALQAFHARLAPQLREFSVVVLSELGRSVVENRMSGTDDGHAGAVLMLSNAQRGVRVEGDWPGLLSIEPESYGLRASVDMGGLIEMLLGRHGFLRAGRVRA